MKPVLQQRQNSGTAAETGFTVAVESGAGQLASFDDKAFVQAGAEIVEGIASGSQRSF